MCSFVCKNVILSPLQTTQYFLDCFPMINTRITLVSIKHAFHISYVWSSANLSIHDTPYYRSIKNFVHLFLFKIIFGTFKFTKYVPFHNKSNTTRTIVHVESFKNFFNIVPFGIILIIHVTYLNEFQFLSHRMLH